MTISSSLNAGVSGLNAHAARLGTISDNIANSSTYGYRRADTDFHDLVVNGSGGGRYVAGGVRTTSQRLVDQRGSLVSTSNATDIAIGGRGMLPVTSVSALGNSSGTYPLALTPTGSFRPDADGVLRTDGGLVLLGWPAAADGKIGAFPRDTVAGLEPVTIHANQAIADPTTAITLGVNLPAAATQAGAPGTPQTLAVEYFGNLGTSETLDVTFEPTVPGAGASNEWTMTVRDRASGGAVVGSYGLTFDGTRGGRGTLASATTLSGGAYDPATGAFTVATAGGPVDVTIGKPGDPAGLTQLASAFAPVAISKNGSPVGSISSVEVDAKGILTAVYDTGFTRQLYQIPIVDVPNQNGLTAGNDQTFTISNQSGAFFLWDAGDGPTGDMVGFAREQSATDVASELTKLIETQRAYSSNAKVIQTVDEMWQETTNIKR